MGYINQLSPFDYIILDAVRILHKGTHSIEPIRKIYPFHVCQIIHQDISPRQMQRLMARLAQLGYLERPSTRTGYLPATPRRPKPLSAYLVSVNRRPTLLH